MKKSSKRRVNAYFRGHYPTKLKAYEEFERPNRRSDILEYGFVFVMITGALSLGAYKLAIEPATIAANEAAISASCMQQVAGIAPAAGGDTALQQSARALEAESDYVAIEGANTSAGVGQRRQAGIPANTAGNTRPAATDTYALPADCN